MSLHNEIEKRVNEICAKRNGKVIYDALFRAKPKCHNCAYPENHEKFSSLLLEYEKRKIEIHRFRRRMRDMLSIDRLNSRYYGTYDAMIIRNKLNHIWPCENCRKIYNPTYKWNCEGSIENLFSFLEI